MYELVIVGGGPGGVAAGVYAARKKIKTALVTETFGGQSVVSTDIQNWIGTPSVSGLDLAQNLENHLRAQKDVIVIDGDRVVAAEKIAGGFRISTQNGQILETKTLLIASGSHHRKLGVKGEKEFDGRGVAYCSTCDAPLFGGKDVIVVGAGNAGLEAVRDLLPYAAKVRLLVRSEKIRGDALTFDKIRNDPKVEIMYQAEVQEISGDTAVKVVKYIDKKENQIKESKTEGVFIEIGATPNAEFLGGLVKKNEAGAILVDYATQQTSEPGVWAAGDVTALPYRQNNISVGDAIKAVLNIHDYLHRTG